MKLTEDDVYFIDVDDDKGSIDERGILISCNHEDKNSLFGECEKCEEIKSQILENQNIVESVKTILETALTQRARLIPLLTDENPHRDISRKEFDRVCIIIDYLRPMWKHNTGKDIQEIQNQEMLKDE